MHHFRGENADTTAAVDTNIRGYLRVLKISLGLKSWEVAAREMTPASLY